MGVKGKEFPKVGFLSHGALSEQKRREPLVPAPQLVQPSAEAYC